MRVTFSKKYKFPQEFAEWETKCRGLKGSSIGTKGDRSLYDFVSNHGFKSPDRNTKDQTGAKDVLANIGVLLEKRLFTTKEVEILEKVEDILGDMSSATATNNPANVPFTIKEKEGSREVYGHFTGEDKNWFSEKRNSARPPIWQALFSEGNDGLGIKGLLPMVEDAQDEIEVSKDIVVTDLSQAEFNELASSKQFQNAFVKIANANVKGKDKYSGAKHFDNKSIRDQLAEKKIKISKRAVLKIFKIENNIGAITFDLSSTQVSRLLGLYFSRKIIKGDTDWKSLIKG